MFQGEWVMDGQHVMDNGPSGCYKMDGYGIDMDIKLIWNGKGCNLFCKGWYYCDINIKLFI